jgi:hypothetical protein
LNQIYKQHQLPLDLFIRIKKSIGTGNQKNIEKLEQLMQDLPQKMKTEVSLYIYEQRYAKIVFMRTGSISFILWLCPLLKPNIFQEKQFIYTENEPVNEILFLTNGTVQFVLPKYMNTPYINVLEGYSFGSIDIVGSLQALDHDLSNWWDYRHLFKR